MIKKAVFFDLDNTLYDYSSYYSEVLKELARYLSERYNASPEKVHSVGMELLREKTSRYPLFFNKLLESFDIPQYEVSTCLELFNCFSGRIYPYEDVIPTLEKLKNRGYILGLITDGNPKRQKRKVKLLGLEDYFDIIVFTHDLNSPKPSRTPYEYALKKADISPELAYYVGDDPNVDFKGAKEAGMSTIRILSGEFKVIPKSKYVDYEINSLNEIFKIIDKSNRGK